jgi:hypothetical protein
MSSSNASRGQFRFSLRELLVAMVLLAASFTWPLLFFFVVPLIVTRVLSQMGYGSYAPIVVASAASLVGGVLISFYYWHYTFAQPSVLASLRELRSIDQLSWVEGLKSGKHPTPGVPIAYFPPASKLTWNTPTELVAEDRILAEFGQHKVAIRSTEPISPELLGSMWNAAEQSGLLITGEPRYPDTKSLRGHVGIARGRDGSRFAFAALMGGQHSNDHYPYYEFVVPLDRDKLSIETAQWFYLDIAGMEGANWLGFATIIFIVMMPVTIALQLMWTWRKKRKAVPVAIGATELDHQLLKV